MISPIVIAVIISGISGFLAAILVFAERVISNYGEVELNINNGEKESIVRGGASLLEILVDQKLFIPSACGGRGTCGYCKVKVMEGGGPLLPTEEPFLDDTERAGGYRLSCQVKVRQPINIEIPAELLSIREYVCQCEKTKNYTYDIKEFNLKLIDPKEIKYKPGQYIQLLAPAYEGSPEEVYRAYSISSDPADNSKIELIVRRVPQGICTTYLFDHLKDGQELKINGPYGQFYLRETAAPIIFIAGGSGIAPIKSILHHMQNSGIKRKAVFFFGVNTTKDLFLVDEMKQFEKGIPDFEFIPVVAQPEEKSTWHGTTGWVTAAVEEFLKKAPDAGKYESYLCGSPGMIDATVKILRKYAIPEEKYYYDKFA
ncbi:MAG: 2Fe-2S iron-sulfur cluster binding domain-containing protein [bacterium]